MIRGKRKNLALAIVCAIAAMSMSGYVHAAVAGLAEEAETSQSASSSRDNLAAYRLRGVTVEGEQDVLPGGMASTTGTMGFLGDRDIMDVPFSEVTLAQKTIEAFGGPDQSGLNVLVNNPAVRNLGSTLHNNYSIRGINATSTSIYVNGIPGLNTQFSSPLFAMESVQFISGPNSGITGIPSTYETSNAGGIINFVTKKAGAEPITRYKQVFSGESMLAEYVDVGRRFGENDKWGMRFNAEFANGDTAIDGHNMRAQGFALNLDHEDEWSKTNFYAAYRHQDIRGGLRWFGLGSAVTKIPGAPDASKDYGFDGMRKESEGFVLALNHEQKIDDDWKWFLNAGMNHNKLQANFAPQASRLDIINDDGDVSKNIMGTQTVTSNYYGQIGINGKVQTGEVEHDLTLAVEKAWHKIRGTKSNYVGSIGSITGNIYTGVTSSGFWIPALDTGLSSKDQYWGISLIDTIKYKKSQLLLGVHKHRSTVDSYSASTGNHNSSVSSDGVSPTYAYMYQPNEHVSIYASHSEHFDAGEVVGSAYENAGDILDPAKTKQNEIGVKYQNAGLLTSLAFFDLEQANNFVVNRDGLDYYLQDGKQKHKGVEFSVNGRIAPKWNIMGGFLYLNAKQSKTEGGLNDGKTVNGRAKWSAVTALEYEANDSFSVLARMLFTGRAKISNDTLTVPSFVNFDLGVTYKTQIKDVPVTFTAMCYNLFDRDYWIAYGSNLILSTPRTFTLSAAFEF